MFWFVVSSLVAFFFFRKLVFPVKPPIYRVYTQPNHLHGIKTWLFRWVLNRRKVQNAKKKSVSGSGAGYGMRSRNTPEEMDRAQPLNKDYPLAVDAVYFNGGNKDGYYFVAATARRHKGLVQTLLYIRLPGVGMLQLPNLPEAAHYTDKELAYSVAGLEIDVVEAMKTWSLKFDGKLRLVKPDNTSSEVEVTFDLVWSAITPMFDFDTDLNTDAMAASIAREPWNKKFFKNLQDAHQTHHEQFGTIKGDVKLGGDVYKLDISGVRDHSYGNLRDWKDLHRYAIQYCVLEDGTCICLGNICMKPTMTRLIIGYVYHPDGSMDSVSATDLELHKNAEDGIDPDDLTFSFTTGGADNPTGYIVKCHVEQRVIFYMGDNWEARIHERMCTYNVNNRKGWGISEWDYNYNGGKGNLFQR